MDSKFTCISLMQYKPQNVGTLGMKSKQVSQHFSCDHAVPSVRPSVCLSVCHTFFTMFPSSYHHEIFQLQKLSDVHAKGQCQRVTRVKTQFSRFRTITPVRIHICWWNNSQSLMLLRRDALIFSGSSVKFQGHTAKKSLILTPIGCFRTVTSI